MGLCLATVSVLLGLAAGETPAPREPRPRFTPEQAEAVVREVSADVEELRGLKFKRPVQMKLIDGARAREMFKSKIEPWEIDEARYTQQAYEHLALIPAGTDLITRYLDLAEKDVLGFYEPGSETFFLLDHVPEDDARMVMAHELTHALEDQYFDFKTLRKRSAGNSDHATAITSVIEGAAMGVSIAYASRKKDKWAAARASERNSRQMRRYATAPSFVQQSLVMPYTLGLTFLMRGSPWRWYTDGGIRLADLDRAYARPPSSTREILHPETYWTDRPRSAPRSLALPDLSGILGPGWSKATDGSIGELGLAVLTGSKVDLESFDALMPNRWTNDAATGALGDVYQHYTNGDRTTTVLMTRWESERDAEQFHRAMRETRNLTIVRFGVNFIVLAGDFGDKAQPLAAEAMRSMSYWVE